jgi:hypothetical protein
VLSALHGLSYLITSQKSCEVGTTIIPNFTNEENTTYGSSATCTRSELARGGGKN